MGNPGLSGGRLPEHDVEGGNAVAGLQVRRRIFERHHQPGPGGGIADAVQQAVAGVQGIAGEVHLGDEGLGAGGEDREVHVGRAHPVSRRRREP